MTIRTSLSEGDDVGLAYPGKSAYVAGIERNQIIRNKPRSQEQILRENFFEPLACLVGRGPLRDECQTSNSNSTMLRSLGFEVCVKGSHHIFRQGGVEEKINLQRDGNNAKIYQVKQVRAVLLKYRLGESK